MCRGVCRAGPGREVDLLLGQLPSHRANAERTRDFLGAPLAGDDFMARYRAWETDYEAYLEEVCRDHVAPGEGATLLDIVDEKERLLRARGLEDLFAGMKAEENAIAAALFPAIAAEIDDVWEPTPGAWYGPVGPSSGAKKEKTSTKGYKKRSTNPVTTRLPEPGVCKPLAHLFTVVVLVSVLVVVRAQ